MSNSSVLPASASTRNLPVDSEKMMLSLLFVWDGILFRSILMPRLGDDIAISAAARPIPPSETSWQDLTIPMSMLVVRAFMTAFAMGPFAFGTSPPSSPFDL